MANNVWKMTAVDKDGKPVESHPGMTTFMLRGPVDKKIVEQHATILLNSLRRKVINRTGEDPGYKVDKIEPAGDSSVTDENFGLWRPEGAKPVTTPEAVETPAKRK